MKYLFVFFRILSCGIFSFFNSVTLVEITECWKWIKFLQEGSKNKHHKFIIIYCKNYINKYILIAEKATVYFGFCGLCASDFL